jgi:hypothetical protein
MQKIGHLWRLSEVGITELDLGVFIRGVDFCYVGYFMLIIISVNETSNIMPFKKIKLISC